MQEILFAIKIEEIIKAREVLSNVSRKTPVDRSSTFSKMTSSDLFLKLENLQKTGSFKIRGAYNKIISLNDDEKEHGVVAASAGNHAQGVAFSASSLGVSSKIVMPKQASPAKVEATRNYGAEVILYGDYFDESLKKAMEIARDEKKTFVHAYDDESVIAGQGTIGLEILEDLDNLDCVVVPIGGGGLVSGIASALKQRKKNIKVYGVQTESFPSAYLLLKEGRKIEVRRGETIADGIAVKKLGELTSKIISELVDDVFLVSDIEIAEAMFLMLERAKIVSEPAGAASLAALLSGKINCKGKRVVAVVSGGNVDMYTLDQIVSRGLEKNGRLIRLKFNLEDKPGSLREVIDVVSSLGANILDIQHQRIGSEVQIGKAAVTVSLETQNMRHTEQILNGLKERKIRFKKLD